MYSWVTHTFNTIKGECPHGCTYCYMHRWGKQKPLHFDEKELRTDLGSGNFIFIGSSCDMFASDIPAEWIYLTLNHCKQFDNTYLFQSKNPLRFHEFFDYFPKKTRLCTTIETNRYIKEVMRNSPSPVARMIQMSMIGFYPKYVTIEPIMDFDLSDMVRYIRECEPEQVNIGADSGNNNLPEPSAEKINSLISELQKFTKIDRKINLKRLLK